MVPPNSTTPSLVQSPLMRMPSCKTERRRSAGALSGSGAVYGFGGSDFDLENMCGAAFIVGFDQLGRKNGSGQAL
jgi:hypothetical protein